MSEQPEGAAPQPPFTSPSRIVRIAARLTGESVETLTGKDRRAEIVRLRAAITIVCRRYWEREGRKGVSRWSYPAIGRALGGRDHSTIINVADKWPIYTRYQPWLAELADLIEDESKLPDPAPIMIDLGLRPKMTKVEVMAYARQVKVDRQRAAIPMRRVKPKNDFSPGEGEQPDRSHTAATHMAKASKAFLNRLLEARESKA